MMEPNGYQRFIVHGINMNKKTKYIISLAFSAVVLWYGINGMKAAEYLISFLTWFGVFVGIFALGNDKVREKLLEEGRPVSVWISTPITIAYIIIFLYFGWLWTAFGYLVSLCISHDLYSKAEEQSTKENTTRDWTCNHCGFSLNKEMGYSGSADCQICKDGLMIEKETPTKLDSRVSKLERTVEELKVINTQLYKNN